MSNNNLASIFIGLGYDLSALEKGSPEAFKLVSEQTLGMSAEMKRASREGAESFRLIDETIGLHISRPLTRLITQEFPGFASALQSLLGAGAFAAIAGAGVEFFDKISEKIEKARAAQEHLKETSKTAAETLANVLGGINTKIAELSDRDHTLHIRLAGAAEAKAGIDQISKAFDALTAAEEKANSIWNRGEIAAGDFFSHVAEGWTHIIDFLGDDHISKALGGKNLHDSIYGTQDLQNMKAALSDMRDSFDEALNADKLNGTHEALTKAQNDIKVAKAYLDDMKKSGDKAGEAIAAAAVRFYQGSAEVESATQKLEGAEISSERMKAAASAIADLYKSMGESIKKLDPETDPIKKLSEEIRLMRQKAEEDFAELGRNSNSALQMRAALAALDTYEARLDRLLAKAKADAEVLKAQTGLPTTIAPGTAPQLGGTGANPTLGAGGTTGAQFDAFLKDDTAQLKLAAQAFQELVTPQQKFDLVQDELNHLLDKGKINLAAFTAALQVAREEMAKGADEIEKMLKRGGANGGMQAFLMQLKGEGSKGSDAQFTFDLLNKGLQGFEDETVKALTGARTNWASFFESLDQMALKFLLNKAISALLNGGLGSLFGGGASGAGSAGAGVVAPPVMAYAAGTDNAQGGMAWVGENGPELMNVPAGASITPNNALRAGHQVHINIDAKGAEIGVEEKIARAISVSAPQMIMRAVVEASEARHRTPR